MVFDVLAAAVAALMHLIFSQDRTLTSGKLVWGIGDRLIFVAYALLLASAIWMLVAKIKAKKEFAAANQ